MSIKMDDIIDGIGQEPTDLNWDNFKVFLEGKGFVDSTVRYETSVAKRVIKDGITEDNMYDRCPIITRYVRHDVRRAIKRINEYKKWEEDKCK